jgi:hypothetical protein
MISRNKLLQLNIKIEENSENRTQNGKLLFIKSFFQIHSLSSNGHEVEIEKVIQSGDVHPVLKS